MFLLKSRLLFNILCFFSVLANKHLGCVYLKKYYRYYKTKPWAYYFYVKTMMPADFDICISVPLIDRGMIVKPTVLTI